PSKSPFGGLVRISSRPDSDRLALLRFSQVASQNLRGRRFRIDAIFEFQNIAFHELVGVARITVLTSELAAAIWVDSPGERHPGLTPVQHTTGSDLQIFNLALS